MTRHSDPTLTDLEALYDSFRDNVSDADAERWWSLVLRVEASLDSDNRASRGEHDAMRRLREKVSDLYGARNRGRVPDYTPARTALISLQHSLERRTTGLDGHRLR